MLIFLEIEAVEIEFQENYWHALKKKFVKNCLRNRIKFYDVTLLHVFIYICIALDSQIWPNLTQSWKWTNRKFVPNLNGVTELIRVWTFYLTNQIEPVPSIELWEEQFGHLKFWYQRGHVVIDKLGSFIAQQLEIIIYLSLDRLHWLSKREILVIYDNEKKVGQNFWFTFVTELIKNSRTLKRNFGRL